MAGKTRIHLLRDRSRRLGLIGLGVLLLGGCASTQSNQQAALCAAPIHGAERAAAELMPLAELRERYVDQCQGARLADEAETAWRQALARSCEQDAVWQRAAKEESAEATDYEICPSNQRRSARAAFRLRRELAALQGQLAALPEDSAKALKLKQDQQRLKAIAVRRGLLAPPAAPESTDH